MDIYTPGHSRLQRRRAAIRHTRQQNGLIVVQILAGTFATAGALLPVSATLSDQAKPHIAYTHQQPDGNRVATGTGALPSSAPFDIALDETPIWVAAVPRGDASLWIVVLQSGRVQAFHVEDRRVAPFTVAPGRLPSQMPPLLISHPTTGVRIANTITEDVATHAYPATWHTPANGHAYVNNHGDLVITIDGKPARLPVRALPDSRILSDERGRLLLLTAPTTRYGHGVLGDTIEASGITLVETFPEPRIVRVIKIPHPAVIEGLAPIWSDLTGDGVREIVVTVSDEQSGARIVVFDESGRRIAAGPAIGTGNRWRHQLAVGPFGPDAATELVAVRTPHIGGIVEFYRLVGARLEIVATRPGYSTHLIGSRNLDTAVAGDWDGDGRMEILLPNDSLTMLIAVRRMANGIVIPWVLALGGTLQTNLAAVRLSGDRLALGAGTNQKLLRLWLP